jgi:Protein of unknown function (DUF3433)
MIGAASSQRQPFIELRRDKSQAASAECTILLDYEAHPALWKWFIAFRNRYIHLGMTFLLSLAMWIVPPLGAHLFTVTTVPFNSTVTVTSSSAFNFSANSAYFDVRPAFDDSLVTQLYGGYPLPWTTTEYAFSPFNTDGEARSSNLTANTTAYSAYLDCQAYASSQSETIYSTPDGSDSVTMYTIDRGCPVSGQLKTVNGTTLYGYTFSIQNCSYESGISRSGIYAATYDPIAPEHISNLTLISCISSYWQTVGNLTVSITPNQGPTFIAFSPDSKKETDISEDPA